MILHCVADENRARFSTCPVVTSCHSGCQAQYLIAASLPVIVDEYKAFFDLILSR